MTGEDGAQSVPIGGLMSSFALSPHTERIARLCYFFLSFTDILLIAFTLKLTCKVVQAKYVMTAVK